MLRSTKDAPSLMRGFLNNLFQSPLINDGASFVLLSIFTKEEQFDKLLSLISVWIQLSP